MNTGQMLITIAALLLLSLVILRVNNNFLSTSTVLMENKFGVLAVSLATSVLEEAKGKAFDHNTDSAAVSDVNNLSTLGPDGGEVDPLYNDFDDFDGLTRVDTTLPSAPFTIQCVVDYVNSSTPNSTTNSKTWHKKMTVTVSSPFMQDTVRLSSIYSYFYFR